MKKIIFVSYNKKNFHDSLWITSKAYFFEAKIKAI